MSTNQALPLFGEMAIFVKVVDTGSFSEAARQLGSTPSATSRGVARLEPAVVSSLGFLSPITAVLLGWGILGQQLSAAQIAGMMIVVASVWLSQRAQRPAAIAPAPRPL